MSNDITRKKRSNIFQILQRDQINLFGELNDVDFLIRIYDLDAIPSTDPRFTSSLKDIQMHREHFDDWEDYWIFKDKRFDLASCPDEILLKFLCETIHPVVRSDIDEQDKLLRMYNDELSESGYHIIKKTGITGNIHYEANNNTLTHGVSNEIIDYDSELNSKYVQQQIVRIETNIEKNPDLSIGTSKELVEGILKSFLSEQGIKFSNSDNIITLSQLVFKKIHEISDDKGKIMEITKRINRASTTIIQSISEFRNLYGTGHGREVQNYEIDKIYAALIANLSTTIVFFIIQSHKKYFKR